MTRKANWVFLLKNEKLIWLFYGFPWCGKKRLFFGVEVKVVYSFSTKEYELVLRLCPKGPPSNWEREKKNIKLRVKPKDGKKKMWNFRSRDGTSRSNKVWAYFYKVFVKHKSRGICEAWINVVKWRKRKRFCHSGECNEKRKKVSESKNIHKINLGFSLVGLFWCYNHEELFVFK